MVLLVENQVIKEKRYTKGKKLSIVDKTTDIFPCEILSLLVYDSGHCAEFSYHKGTQNFFSMLIYFPLCFIFSN